MNKYPNKHEFTHKNKKKREYNVILCVIIIQIIKNIQFLLQCNKRHT